VADFTGLRNQCQWLNWQQIYNLLLGILKAEKLPSTTSLFCQDLCSLLDKKDLHPFRAIKDIFNQVQFYPVDKVFLEAETIELRDDFLDLSLVYQHSHSRCPSFKQVYFSIEAHFSIRI
jgi:hypothetical protein